MMRRPKIASVWMANKWKSWPLTPTRINTVTSRDLMMWAQTVFSFAFEPKGTLYRKQCARNKNTCFIFFQIFTAKILLDKFENYRALCHLVISSDFLLFVIGTIVLFASSIFIYHFLNFPAIFHGVFRHFEG